MLSALQKEQLEKTVEEYLDSRGFELIDLRFTGSIGRPVIEVYADIDGGITTEDLAEISKSLQHKLAADGFFNDQTSLIVSSPGLNRILKKERDFDRFKGKMVDIWLNEKIGNRGKLRGILAGYDDGSVHVNGTEEGDIALAPGRWKEIRLVPELPEGFK
ncbi:MAG TPA: ribosome maturation factor RimP [Firmicutes bacterium]|nr:ribosome maturation factor RimP [Bacillota bacterium]